MEYIQDILYLREAVEQEALARIMQMSDRTQVLQRMRVAPRSAAGTERGYRLS